MEGINGFFGLIFLLNFMNAFQLDILLSSVLALKVFESENATHRDYLSVTFSTLIIVGFLAMMAFLFRMSYKFSKKNQVSQQDTKTKDSDLENSRDNREESVLANLYVYQKYKEFTSDISPEKRKSLYVRYFMPINFSKDLLMAVIIVMLGDHGVAQISLCLVISAGLAILNLKTRPFNSKRLNFLLCTMQVIYAVIDLIFLIMKLTENDISQQARSDLFGNIQIGLISSLILITIVNGFYEGFLVLISALKKCKQKRRV